MAMPCYVTVEAEKQGKIDGSCEQEDHKDSIMAFALDHKVSIPIDPQSGQSSGKRIHGPLAITKEKDKASPKLAQALCTGEKLKKVEIKYFRVAADGKEEHYYTEELSDAIVVSMEPFVPTVFQKENDAFRHMEKVSFTYSKIKWKWIIDGVEAEDSWKGSNN